MNKFGRCLENENWTFLDEKSSPSVQVKNMESKLMNYLESCLPQKKVKLSSYEKPWISYELKYLDRRKKREYSKNGRSEKFLKLKAKFDQKYKEAAGRYINKNVSELKITNPGKAFKILKRMGAPPGESEDEGSFTLQTHLDQNLSTEESLEKIADFFSNISQEYPPLNLNLLPDRVKTKLKSESNYQNCTSQISEFDVIKQIKSSKKTNSTVPGDLPKPLIQEYPEELARPVTKIFQNMLASKQWPASWRIEHGVPLQKIQNPESESQLRIISLTSFFSKVFENLVIKWLLEYIGGQIDTKQFGGQRGNSITHYLIEFINFILYNQDMKDPHAVLALLVDYSQAFNRSNHHTIITILSDMGVPKWLL